MRKKNGTYEEELYDKMWKTKGARFNAYERLRTTKNLSFYTTSLLSAYLIIANLLMPFNLLPNGISSEHISFISVSLSILLLVFVILEGFMDYGLKADNFHNCSKEIGKIFTQLDYLIDQKEQDKSKYIDINKNYEKILDLHDNHSPIDYDLHKTKHDKDFNLNWFVKLWIQIKANYLIYYKYYLCIYGPPIAIMIWLK